MIVKKSDLERDISQSKLQFYIDAGWSVVESTSKKKKAEKPAETAPEAALEDLGNDINKGE
ncbi:hypothetical protein UFOVP641_37 [uncultured Caudovirales phage]|uniref:Uncharacterized protein n=1 Tax=uncultured Caudovirales phage TaxID=2100421 RepID=A0A6J5NA04_9CAUD|nr:hypothetical protein UFOVP641_37 [uncultured Caudovirales phage]